MGLWHSDSHIHSISYRIAHKILAVSICILYDIIFLIIDTINWAPTVDQDKNELPDSWAEAGFANDLKVLHDIEIRALNRAEKEDGEIPCIPKIKNCC
jgi:hypothetical protein